MKIKSLKIKSLLLLILCAFPTEAGKCNGRFVNSVSDICWSCMFPIKIGGIRMSPSGEDTDGERNFFCTCGSPVPRVGIQISFWEPVRLIDVTRNKFCLDTLFLVNMGGISLGGSSKGHGTVDKGTSGGRKRSFYQVHYYIYPVIYWLELLTDFVCIERSKFDVAYITEFDPGQCPCGTMMKRRSDSVRFS